MTASCLTRMTALAATALAAFGASSCDVSGAAPPCPACPCDHAISALPFQAQSPGRYCLGQDLKTASAGPAITVEADWVTIDLNGHRLEATGGPSTPAIGVSAQSRSYVTVRNGVVAGFERGIYLIGPGSRGAVVEDVRAIGNRRAGIQIFGEQSRVERCTVGDTGGSTAEPQFAFGINVAGNGSQVLGNFVHHTFATGAGGWAAAIQSDQADAMIVGNRVIDVSGGDQNYGIFCNGGGVVPLLRDNLVSRAATSFNPGCILVGGTNYP